ncbi:MAG: polysaccharide deacetylase family protein [Clostridia bacterium]|nr:polysaccharide deacetylase family protein [Clostridia bacterium]
MKKLLAAILAVLLMFSCAVAEKQPLPELFKFTQETQPRENVRKDVYIQRTYPVTANEQVNAEMRQVIDQVVERGRQHLPTGAVKKDKSYLRAGAGVSRTGQSWMSFLSTGAVKHEYEQIHVELDARVYDLATGGQVTMSDLFAPESAGWDVMAEAVRTQLSTYFPQLECDGAALDALCSREALEAVPFTLTAGSLRLHYKADALYPGRTTLMHVRILYSDIRQHMTAEAQHQTDNSCYKLAALTFDDGPAHLYSINVVDTLRAYGADATFFLVGKMMKQGHYVMAYEHDAGFPLAYHSYDHITEGKGIAARIPEEWQQFCDEMVEVTGTIPTMMRAPGGYADPFIRAEIGLPLIHWTTSSGDGNGNREFNESAHRMIAGNVGVGAQDGAVILMHDLRPTCYQYLAMSLEKLEERGFLCVTVEELFDSCGIRLQPNTVYTGAGEYLNEQSE